MSISLCNLLFVEIATKWNVKVFWDVNVIVRIEVEIATKWNVKAFTFKFHKKNTTGRNSDKVECKVFFHTAYKNVSLVEIATKWNVKYTDSLAFLPLYL